MLSKKDNVDIIMPNFNKGKFILKAVNSVIGQSYKNWKLYIIDDNSNDNSKKIINTLGLANRINHYPSELSGGEAQRIAISRALINSPEIILADEPTGSLDSDNAKLIFKILFNLKNKNRIIIFATHNRYFANMADCKIVMNDGNMQIINATA